MASSSADCVIPGAGAFELFAHQALGTFRDEVKGRARLGVQAFSEALLVIPKVLAANAGFDAQETIVKLQEEVAAATREAAGDVAGARWVGLDLNSGEALVPVDHGIFDNFNVKKQIINSW